MTPTLNFSEDLIASSAAQFQYRIGSENMCVVHVSLVPVIGVVGEQKTKPTQHSVQVLRSLGLSPTMLACRCSEPLEESVREKLVGHPGMRSRVCNLIVPHPIG